MKMIADYFTLWVTYKSILHQGLKNSSNKSFSYL